jgi:uncharacterized protein YjbI with pentapeptide repeats
LAGTDFVEADFVETDLVDVDFAEPDLVEPDLARPDFGKTDLDNTDVARDHSFHCIANAESGAAEYTTHVGLMVSTFQ